MAESEYIEKINRLFQDDKTKGTQKNQGRDDEKKEREHQGEHQEEHQGEVGCTQVQPRFYYDRFGRLHTLQPVQDQDTNITMKNTTTTTTPTTSTIDVSSVQSTPTVHKLCRYFQNGRCSLGDRCRWKHIPKSEELCYDFTRNRCPWGERCHRLHSISPRESEHPAPEPTSLDSCKTTVDTKVEINESPEEPERDTGESRINDAVDGKHCNSELSFPSKTFNPKDEPIICRDFQRGRCYFGSRCRYKHIPKSEEICYDFTRNQCPWGGQCHRKYILPPQQQQPARQDSLPLHDSDFPRTKDEPPDVFTQAEPQVRLANVDQTLSQAKDNGSQINEDDQQIHGVSFNSTTVPLGPIEDDLTLERKATDMDSSRDDDHSTIVWESEWYPTTDAIAWMETSSTSSATTLDAGGGWYPSTGASAWDRGRSRSISPSSDNTENEIASTCSKPPLPRNKTTCWRWLQGRCDRGYRCMYVHGDLECASSPESLPYHSKPLPPNLPPSNFSKQQPLVPQWTFPLRDHIRVRFGPGFTISDVQTGFETPWVYLSGLPSTITTDQLNRVLGRYGSVDELKFYHHRPPLVSAKARMGSTKEAQEVVGILDGSRLRFGKAEEGAVISAKLSLHVRDGKSASLQDTAVRITFEAPSKRGYAGYPTLERAKAAVNIANQEYTTTWISACIHVGLPAVGAHTVKFSNLPLKIQEKSMKKYANPEGMMWEKENYRSVDDAAGGIRWILESSHDAVALGLEMLKFDVLPPPYRDGKVRVWAYFATPKMARDAVGILHTRKLKCTGHTRIFVNHVQTLSYAIPVNTYTRAEQDIEDLKAALWRQGKRNTMLSMSRLDNVFIAKLSADDLKDLGELKAELERTLQGEVVRNDDGEMVWDDFFARADGKAFLRALEGKADVRGVVIHDDPVRRRLKLFGAKEKRDGVRQLLVKKHEELRAGELRSMSIPGSLIGPFMGTQLGPLKRLLGSENVKLDLWEQKLTIRGSLSDFQAAQRAVKKLTMPQPHPRASANSCPVCFGQVELPVSLTCGHSYCRGCLVNYLEAAKDHRFFPLTCLGDEARCSMALPISLARDILPLGEFDALVEAAFAAHVDSHPKEFHYCPSPDCMQVYRPAPAGAVLQCPSCLIRICPECHVEYHEGFGCPEKDGGERLFREWMDKNDVKRCPGCKVPIERSEGCNHVTCTRCRAHICWVCLETFPGGEGIYSHMRNEHGGIGV
ncbi:ring finger protein [Moniliophthora roreri MCA 2997]|uniref:RBR-type E3 ubiquitin transferase n=1 Tax=Moniliophthora roreri (strain MCA 2997) TaxID=1381753 RepID=V2XBW0_MONRO|nr:ring finger protein [Moniliophthora roreri MCA 2997]